MEESISLKDIARMCNVSVSTVSKAMNDRPDISSSKKEEIRRIEILVYCYRSRRVRDFCMSISPEFSTALRLLWKRGDML